MQSWGNCKSGHLSLGTTVGDWKGVTSLSGSNHSGWNKCSPYPSETSPRSSSTIFPASPRWLLGTGWWPSPTFTPAASARPAGTASPRASRLLHHHSGQVLGEAVHHQVRPQGQGRGEADAAVVGDAGENHLPRSGGLGGHHRPPPCARCSPCVFT